MIKESLQLIYDGISSESMDITVASTQSGLYDEPFLAQQNIIEDRIEGRNKPYFKYIEREPLEIPLSIAFKDKWNDIKIQRVAEWLHQEDYKPLQFEHASHKIYYAMPVNGINVIHDGLKQGYLNITFRCNTFHAFSKFEKSKIHDCSNNTLNGIDVEFYNKGNLPLPPIVNIYKVGNGDVTIQNNSNGGTQFTFSNLTDKEELVIDNEYHEISTSLSNTFRYTNFNMNWLEFTTGQNYLKVYGDCYVSFEYQYRYI